MNYSAEPQTTRRDTLVFVFCVILSVMARLAPAEITSDVASGLRGTLLAPFLTLQSETVKWQERRTQFATVEQQRDSVLAIASQLDGLVAENQRLRRILGLGSRMPARYVAAEVLHQTQPTEGVTIVVSAGARDGVERWAPVVALGGLIGTVLEVDRTTSLVMTWTHPDFRVSATAMGDSAVGIVQPRLGEGGVMMMELRGVAYGQRVPEGTMVYTSAHGGGYPRDIPIGRVRGIVDEREGWSRSYLLEPAVHPAGAGHVLIVIAETDDLGAVFDGPAR